MDYRAIKLFGVVYNTKENDFLTLITDLYEHVSKVIIVDPGELIAVKKPKISYTEDSGLFSSLLHKTSKKALEYKDCTGHYFQNGNFIPDWIYKQRGSREKTIRIFQIENEWLQNFAINRFGKEKLLNKLESKILDEKEEYQLLNLKVGRRNCGFLRMINPSSGEIHFEGVLPGIKTVDDALAWRLGIDVYNQPNFKS